MSSRPASFRKEDRITKEAEFRTVLRRGLSVRKDAVQIFFTRGAAARPRLGIRVSKRNFKRAVERNTLKRRIREYFRKRKGLFLQPCDLIVQVGSGRLRAGLAPRLRAAGISVEAHLESALKEAGILRG